MDDALERLGVRAHAELPVKVLSQGQKRRSALARLLVSGCPLWVLDEPFNALDKAAVATVREAVSQHLASGGMALLTTHQDVPIAGSVRTLALGA